MPAVLEGEKKLKRLVRIHGIGLVEVTIAETGLAFRVPKTRKYVNLSWGAAVRASETGVDVPSYLMGKAYEFLVNTVEKQTKKDVKKANKKL